MKKKVILGFLVGVLLLFFTISAWALDSKRAQLIKNNGWPEQERVIVPITPQTIDTYSSTIKFIFISNTQQILILIDKTTTKTSTKVDNSVKNLTNGVKEQDE